MSPDPALDPAAPALCVRDLRKTYDNGVQALKGVSLDVAPGDFHALLGPNGAGKSTLIGIVSSLVNKTAGSVQVFGVDIDADRSAAMRLIGLVPQEFNFNMFEKPLDICVNYAGFYGVPRAQALERAEQGVEIAGGDVEADALQRLHAVVVGLAQVADAQRGRSWFGHRELRRRGCRGRLEIGAVSIGGRVRPPPPRCVASIEQGIPWPSCISPSSWSRGG